MSPNVRTVLTYLLFVAVIPIAALWKLYMSCVDEGAILFVLCLVLSADKQDAVRWLHSQVVIQKRKEYKFKGVHLTTEQLKF